MEFLNLELIQVLYWLLPLVFYWWNKIAFDASRLCYKWAVHPCTFALASEVLKRVKTSCRKLYRQRNDTRDLLISSGDFIIEQNFQLTLLFLSSGGHKWCWLSRWICIWVSLLSWWQYLLYSSLYFISSRQCL